MRETAEALLLMLDLMRSGAIEAAFHKGLYLGLALGALGGCAATVLLWSLTRGVAALFRRNTP